MYQELYALVYVCPLNQHPPGNHRDKYADHPGSSLHKNSS